MGYRGFLLVRVLLACSVANSRDPEIKDGIGRILGPFWQNTVFWPGHVLRN